VNEDNLDRVKQKYIIDKSRVKIENNVNMLQLVLVSCFFFRKNG